MTANPAVKLLEEFCVGFFDDDHVIRLARALLSPSDEEQSEYVNDFFAPEHLGASRWEKIVRNIALPEGQLAPLGSLPSMCEAIVFRRGRIGPDILDRHPKLRLIQRLGAQPEGIDLAEAKSRGIQVSCMPRPSLAMVAEHALMQMLALTKKLVVADRGVRRAANGHGQKGEVAYNWLGLEDIGTLWGKSVGIVGMGEVGILLAERARSFGMNVLYCDDRPIPESMEQRLAAQRREKQDLLANSDFVSLHIPATPANRCFIDQAELALMKPTAFLVNTSRGSVINEDALLDALSGGKLAGAGLDVHASEPRSRDELTARDDVVLTPHIAGGSRLGVIEEIERIFDNIRAVKAGCAVPHAIVELEDWTDVRKSQA